MRVVPVEEGNEHEFWDIANQDPFRYYFFIMDWRQAREKTRIFLAAERGKVEGLMLLYGNHTVQLRGSRNAVRSLFDLVNFGEVELQAPLDCEDIVVGKYAPRTKTDLMLMLLHKGEENIQVKHAPTKLNVEDADQVARIMREADPEYWSDMTAENRRESLQTAYWLGIRQDSRLVAIGNTRFVDFGSNIGVIATDKNYRNRGYATSIVSSLTQEILKKSPTAAIHVLDDNAPAVHVYSKVGFKPHKHYLFLRGKRI